MSLPIVSRSLPRLVVALVVTLASFGAASRAQALEGEDFVVADDDGYGIAECMRPGVACGRVMADAWCEAHGHGHASAFGLADDITGSTKVSTAPAAPVAPSAVVIHCGE